MSKKYLHQFVLVGGTSLALQFGWRKSIDLDLFTINDFSSDILLENLNNDFKIQVNLKLEQSLVTEINGIKVDFIRFRYPFNFPLNIEDSIRLLSAKDIAPMKLDAISGRGSKKDFYDLFFLLQLFSLEDILNLYQEKYKHQTLFHIIKSLVYFNDAENQPDPIVMDKSITWKTVKDFIIEKVKKI